MEKINELNLYKLFSEIIKESKVMARFVVSPGYGNDINKNNLGEIVTDILGGITEGVKYPLCVMFPPVEVIEDYDKGWSRFKCSLFFLTPEFESINSIQGINPNNNLSMQTIQMIWEEMRSCAIDFRKVFKFVTEKNLPPVIRDGETFDLIDRYSGIGNDRLAGVGISFELAVSLGCEIHDYSDTSIDLIRI